MLITDEIKRATDQRLLEFDFTGNPESLTSLLILAGAGHAAIPSVVLREYNGNPAQPEVYFDITDFYIRRVAAKISRRVARSAEIETNPILKALRIANPPPDASLIENLPPFTGDDFFLEEVIKAFSAARIFPREEVMLILISQNIHKIPPQERGRWFTRKYGEVTAVELGPLDGRTKEDDDLLLHWDALCEKHLGGIMYVTPPSKE